MRHIDWPGAAICKRVGRIGMADGRHLRHDQRPAADRLKSKLRQARTTVAMEACAKSGWRQRRQAYSPKDIATTRGRFSSVLNIDQAGSGANKKSNSDV